MPRTGRASVGGVCYHVLNRGNNRRDIFHKPGDFQAFVTVLREAAEEIPIRVLAYCLMPNHFHLVLWPHADGDLGKALHWICTAHVRRYHKHYHSSGHVYQGRFKAFPIEEDEHLLTVLRYAERNALRAGLVERAEDWRWSSAGDWDAGTVEPWLEAGPVPRPRGWLEWVNRPLTEAELARVRQSVMRGSPYGSETWVAQAVQRFGLEHRV